MKDGKVVGDPTEVALLQAAVSTGVSPDMPRLDEIPFETPVGYMATLNKGRSENAILVKGAPERVLPLCRTEQVQGRATKMDRAKLDEELDGMADRALRVLALAKKSVPQEKTSLGKEDLRDLTFIAFCGMIEPPRPEAKEAVQECRGARIRVIMITGDHRKTAKAIGGQLGLLDHGGKVVTGEELEAMNDTALAGVVNEANIFARTTPEHKFRIVKALREKGEVVAVTGDGVNDTPALKAGNIGVAMGLTGTDAAKATADIVLKDDNFATIVAAVEEGRDIYTKLQKIVTWMIPTNIGEALMLFFAILLGATLPLLPLQILWINLVTAITLALPLIFEPREPGLLKRPPNPPSAQLIDRSMLQRFAIVSGLMVLGTYGIFELYTGHGRTVDVARTAAVNTLVFFEMFHLFNSRSLTESAFTVGLRKNNWLFIGIGLCFLSQLGLTYVPGLNVAFGTAGLNAADWLLSAAIASSVLFAVELEKALIKRAASRARPSPASTA